MAKMDEESANALLRELCKEPRPSPERRLPDASALGWCGCCNCC